MSRLNRARVTPLNVTHQPRPNSFLTIVLSQFQLSRFETGVIKLIEWAVSFDTY